MISIKGLTYYVGGKTLYEDASLFIKENSKIGLVGLNGTGKSTLLKILWGDITPEKGKVNKSNEATIEFLNQDMLSYKTDESILNVAMEAFADVIKLQQRIETVIQEMERDYKDSLVEDLAVLQVKFEQMGGYEIQSKVERVLEGIGFATKDLSRPLSEFSGGWRMRVLLAKLLLQEPSLLMLDEPTNHLDIKSIQWLEGYLVNYPKSVIVISHDRSFLDKVTNTTVEVALKKLNVYAGNYSFYEKEKTANELSQHNAYMNQQKEIKKTERFINRFRAKSTKAGQVQSRIKALEKMDKVEDVAKTPSKVKLKFKLSRPSGKEVVRVESISQAYGTLSIFKDSFAKIIRGDRIALIGPNGEGKTTLLKFIAGIERPMAGTVIEGYNVDKVFYAQHQVEALNLDNTILEEMNQAHPTLTPGEIRSTLGALLFVKDDVQKRIKVLSGGEKARVALAKVILSGANFIILDEPTNHLDMISIDILIHALEQYQGTFIIVSHNRYFIKKLANKIWFIEDGKVKVFPDDYDAYTFWKKNREV